MNLARLHEPEVAQLVAALLGDEPPAALLAILAKRAAGTPFAIEGIVRSLVDNAGLRRPASGWTLEPPAGTELPADLRELILDRLERLPEPAREVVDWVATEGGSLAHPVLVELVSRDVADLRPALASAQAAGIVASEDEADHVVHRLTHPRVQEVAYSELGAVRRRRLHTGPHG